MSTKDRLLLKRLLQLGTMAANHIIATLCISLYNCLYKMVLFIDSIKLYLSSNIKIKRVILRKIIDSFDSTQ